MKRTTEDGGCPCAQSFSRRAALCGMIAGGVGLRASGMLRAQEITASPMPRLGGRIRVASISSSTADTLDPAKGALSTDYARHYMLYSGLTRYDTELHPQPALAQDIASRDNKRWDIRLRSGVQFHDGKSLCAADVAFSLMRHKDPATASKMKTVADQFQEVTTSGSDRVTIILRSPNADLPAILADSHFLIVQEATASFRNGIGTGPYRLKEFKPGIRTIVVRNANYWRSGRPYIEEIELIGIPDETARVNALLSGDVQLASAIDPRSIKRISREPGVATLDTQSGLYTDLVMRQDRAPTANPEFAEAIKLLFDRELIRSALFRGHATIANDQPIPPSNPYFFAGLPQRAYDPEKARFLLKKAGLLDVRIPIYASAAADGSIDMAQVLQESAAQIGLKFAVDRVPSDGYWSNHWMRHPLTFGNTNPRPTADLIFSLLFKSDAPWNASGWKNAQFDQLLLAGRGETNEARRRQIYADMQVLIHDRCGVAVPVFSNLIDAYDKRLKGYGSIPIGGLMGYQFAENVWLDG